MKNNTSKQTSCQCHASDEPSGVFLWKNSIPAIVSALMLGLGLLADYLFSETFFTGYWRFGWYAVAYLPVGLPVLRDAVKAFSTRDFFTEFSLMGIATIGAFVIDEYPEGVAVMLFYVVGELFQEQAVSKAKRNIKALLDVSPAQATVRRGENYQTVPPEQVAVGETILVKVGERVPLDGRLLSAKSTFDTAALTGESVPQTIRQGETVKAGMINLEQVIQVAVEKVFADSALSKILNLVQNAIERKAKTELIIRRFARIYTPTVFLLAIAIACLPALFVDSYLFADWLYRALVFLVISCPCALVVSIPLSYFGGIGAASKQGVLFKGANYIDRITEVNTVVMDKTGTLTQGVFRVQRAISQTDDNSWTATAAAIEAQSTHPIAGAIVEYVGKGAVLPEVNAVKEVAGFGLVATVGNAQWLVGNGKLLHRHNIIYDTAIDSLVETTVFVARDGLFLGYFIIADTPKSDAAQAVALLHKAGIRLVVMLSGDKDAIVQQTARELDIDVALGNLLPEDKLHYIENLKNDKDTVVAFVGDGINDTPALALSDVGISMGALGSDAAIEVADVVIQTDQPSKIATAIAIGKKTKQIVKQNITMAISLKIVVMILGALGIASLWAAVFADVGVALMAILNAVRIFRIKKF
ncbi:MAG: cadmium-translocating P-type ATPase [Prevotellaceae bacterium]|nr:cadmium-translocating P-type ATPase [Prevotellaceae bacterium]